MTKNNLMLDPLLIMLNYESYPQIAKLEKKAILVESPSIIKDFNWGEWTSLLRYLSLLEMGKIQVHQFDGLQVGGLEAQQLRYIVLSQVFIGQAFLDNVAQWIVNTYSLKTKGSNVAFHKAGFRHDFTSSIAESEEIFDYYNDFFQKLSTYRNNWIHRFPGGSALTTDRHPEHPGAVVRMKVVIDPTINIDKLTEEMKIKISDVEKQNNGEYLMLAGDFVDWITDTVREMTLTTLDILTDI